ncbi:MAG: hypothetical protein A3A33_04410 [Candidatus Yanofskybacteria bacterium RIFCSPLOWO2_01_FULL_49_25]|uniref:TrpR, YerC/YecD n=1 Tax=Candidatus Yanofskybacteria bacterium RIFCSPLOWO2_01_FULL_49_25 TaxID=1802701 RepID=A0A1F8GWC3_9BACT|nr:MAG: hypothetical protein A3A33_04410 [Candidatus Yanofskybacteria bacterium RIFCSPLOWO2_01_FULL_49_25]
MKKWDNNNTRDLMKTIIKLKTADEAKRFFRDLLTEEELMEFGNRWKAARLLARGVSYTKIEDATRLSSATIARVSRWLNRGMDGYKLMLNRVANHHHNSSPAGKGLS